jgi:outer membrane protein OmpA-like peptidoglycan-associated protein
MFRTSPSRFSRIAVLASGAMLLFGGAALAQPVTVFDDAPSIEQLRSIMIPESRPGASRSIVIQMPETATQSTAVQEVATQAAPAPRRPVARKRPAPVVQAATSAAEPTRNAADEAGAVAFHVNFGFDSAVVPNSAREMIDMIAQLMKETPQVKVRIEGHTDATGSARYNLALSERRALSVGEYMVRGGIDPSRLELVGKGMAEPLTADRYDPTNRRVQFVRID